MWPIMLSHERDRQMDSMTVTMNAKSHRVYLESVQTGPGYRSSGFLYFSRLRETSDGCDLIKGLGISSCYWVRVVFMRCTTVISVHHYCRTSVEAMLTR